MDVNVPCVCWCPPRPQGASDLLKLEFQAVVFYLMWVLEPNLVSSVPLQEQRVLLIAEPSLQPLAFTFNSKEGGDRSLELTDQPA